jgi:competence protein ComEC
MQVAGRILVYYTGSRAIEYGDRMQVTGRLQEPYKAPGFDYPAYLAGQGIHSTISYPSLQVLAVGVGNPLQGLALRLRDALRRAISYMLPHDEAALLIGILLGAPTRSLGSLTEPFIRAGMIHIVAISGLKVAIVAGMISALCARLPASVRWAPALTGVAAYTLVSGATASGLRSALMWGLVVIAMTLGRRSYVWVSLALVAAAMVWWRPLLLWDTGFQLSVVGTAGIVLFTPWLERPLHRLPALLRESVAVTLAAQLATLPITAVGFGQVSLAGPLANGLLLPLLGPIIAAGGLAALIATIVPSLGHLLAYPVYPLLALFIGAVRVLAALPFAAVSWPVVPGAFAAIYYAALLAVASRALGTTGAAMGRVTGPLALLRLLPPMFGLGLALATIAVAVAASRPPDRPVLWLAGAGGGQVLLVQAADGQTMLIDGGADPAAAQALLGGHLPFWSRDLSAVLVSEPDVRHLGGLLGLGALYHLHAAFDPGSVYPSITYAHWRAELRDAAVPESKLRTGQRFDLGAGAHVDVLLPAALTLDDPTAPVAFRITSGNLAVLMLNREALTGDVAPLQADGACLDALVLPTRADPKASAAMVRALRPRLVMLPQPIKQGTLKSTDLAPLPTGIRLWQATEGQELELDSQEGSCRAG